MSGKKQLRVLPSSGAPEPESSSTRGGWVAVGVVAAFVVWLPLAYVASRFTAALVPDATSADALGGYLAALPDAERAALQTKMLLAQALALGLALLAGGALPVRFGSLRVREAAWVGVATTGLAVILATVQGGFSPSSLLVLPLGAGCAALGGWLGRKR